jgi:hypothetical protein
VRDTSLEISTATDSQDIVSAAAQGDTEDARIAEQPMESEQLDGSTVLSFEHPRSERTMLIERLVAAHEQKFSERGKPQASESLTASESLMKLSKGKKCLIEIRKRPGKPTMPSNNQYTSAKHPRADSRSRKDKSRSAARIRGTVRRIVYRGRAARVGQSEYSTCARCNGCAVNPARRPRGDVIPCAESEGSTQAATTTRANGFSARGSVDCAFGS